MRPSEPSSLVERQFGAVAASYAISAVHRGGPDLDAMLAAIPLRGDERLLDAGCGAGHTALAFAPRVAEVVALDLTEPMLEQGRRLAAERDIHNVTFRRGDVERLDVPGGAFDIVTSRYSAHHYLRPQQALREFARALKPGGALLLVDTVAPDTPVADTLLNAVELLRDPSHVRDHTTAQWLALLQAAGFDGVVAGAWPLRLRVDEWTARMRTPAATVAQIRAMLDGAPQEAREALAVGDDAFTLGVALLRGVAPAA